MNHARQRMQASRLLQRSSRRAHSLLRSSIRAGLLTRDDQLVEDALVRALATSRTAVREALQLLADEGLVSRRPRVGTLVSSSIDKIPLDGLVPGEERAPAVDPRVSLYQSDLRFIPITDHFRAVLELDPADESAEICVAEYRVFLGDTPLAVSVEYYAPGLCPGQLSGRLRGLALEESLRRFYGITLGRVDSTIEAVACDERGARVLRIPPGTPVLLREALVRDDRDRPRMLSYWHYRADHVALRATQGTPDPAPLVADVSPPAEAGVDYAKAAPPAEESMQDSSARAHALLRAGIRTGLLPPGTPLAEEDLKRTLATSRNSVRKALRALAEEGLVTRRQRSGTRVERTILSLDLTDSWAVPAGTVGVRQLERRPVPATELGPRAPDWAGETMFLSEQLLTLDGEPFAIRSGYFPSEADARSLGTLVAALGAGPAVSTGLILRGLAAGQIANTVEVTACEERTAKVLGVEIGSPILVRETVVRDVSGRTLVRTFSHYRGDRVALTSRTR